MAVRRAAAAVVAGGLLVASCATPVTAPGVDPPRSCGVAVYSCALPYPSDAFEVADPTTATGVRVEVSETLFRDGLVDPLGPGGTLADAAMGNDGFSPLSPILFQTPDGIDPGSVPADGGKVVTVTDAAGRRLDVRAEVSPHALDDRGRRGVLMIWPVTHWPYGDRITASVGDGLRDPDGRPTMPWDSSTSFTVGTLEAITSPVDRMATVVRQSPHPVRNLTVGPSPFGGAVLVSGQLATTDFRDADLVIARTGTPPGRTYWVDFMLTLPERPASSAGAPVAIYGHGLSIFKETMAIVAGQNADHGVATIAIDTPLHGSRVPADGYLLDLNMPYYLGRVSSMILQGELDLLSVLVSLQTELRSLDVSPLRLGGMNGDGQADLDVDRVFYQGTSMGVFLGTTFVGLAPELRGAFVHVGGAGVIDTISHSLLWGLFSGIMPGGAPPGDAEALLSGAQMLIDRSDSTHYLERIRRNGTPYLLAWTPGDGIVKEPASRRLIKGLDLPRVAGDVPTSGTGELRLPRTGSDDDPIAGFMAHIQFSSDEAARALDQWWEALLA